MKRNQITLTALIAALFLLTAGAPRASADSVTLQLTSCHITTSCQDGTVYGTVTLTIDGTGVDVDVLLNGSNTFVDTGAAGAKTNSFFDFQDIGSTSSVNSIVTDENTSGTPGSLTASPVTLPGGTEGVANEAQFKADGFGLFTAEVGCIVSQDCDGASGPAFNEVKFTVTNETIAQLETVPSGGTVLMVADILCPNCSGGAGTGLVDVSQTSASVPDGGMTVMLLGGALVGFESLRRRFRV
jgi:hypothetical protein